MGTGRLQRPSIGLSRHGAVLGLCEQHKRGRGALDAERRLPAAQEGTVALHQACGRQRTVVLSRARFAGLVCAPPRAERSRRVQHEAPRTVIVVDGDARKPHHGHQLLRESLRKTAPTQRFDSAAAWTFPHSAGLDPKSAKCQNSPPSAEQTPCKDLTSRGRTEATRHPSSPPPARCSFRC
eukprot:6195041-Pleurochrysis_carterae.AAC.1